VITGLKKMITSNGIGKKDITDTMEGRLVDNCPLFYSSKICHPSCNWWSGTKCTYPMPLCRKASQNVKMGQGK
jgi:hypothetical protein